MSSSDVLIPAEIPLAAFCTPCPPCSQGTLSNGSQVAHNVRHESLKDAKILIVDDDVVIVDILRKHLTVAGYQNVVTTSESATAYSLICQESPDIVLLDVMMPVSGLYVLEQLRPNYSPGRIPVVVLTAATDSETKLLALELGASDFLTKPVDVVELLTRVRNNLIAKSHFDQLSRYSAQLEKAVFVDALTETANRRAFEQDVQKRLQEWELRQTPLAMTIVDIDHFKKVNDCYGHRAGDKLLRDVAQAVAKNVAPDAFVCRYGGEEFAVLHSCRSADDAQATAEAVRAAIESTVFVFDELKLRMTVSLGMTLAFDRDNENAMFQRADSALYTSKQSGRNCTHFHDGSSCVRIGEASDDVDGEQSSLLCSDGCDVKAVNNAKVMVVDDDPVMIMVVQKHLKNGGFDRIVSTSDALSALRMVRIEQPDIVLMDVRMPDVSGLEILEELRRDETIRHIPVVILTSSTEADTKSTALELSANDFLSKPVDASELVTRVRNNLLVKAQHDRLVEYSQQLEFEINRQTAEMFASRSEAINCLACAAECRDDQTGHHTVRVGLFAGIIARELQLDKERLACIESAAQLHDVGKIGISDLILKKVGPLTQEERRLMEQHAAMGERILQRCQSPVMCMGAVIAASHHEKWDGTGYPRGLAGEEIPLEGRITAVADVFDALSTKRYYKDAFDLEECFTLIQEGRGNHFDPRIADAFLRCKTDVIRIYHEYSDQQASMKPASSWAAPE